MFRRLLMAIFRLYMKHLVNSYGHHLHISLLYVKLVKKTVIKWSKFFLDIIIIIATDATYYCTLYTVDFSVITQHT